ncbi:MAG: hypothetical protein KatS3mg121_1527 [Gammaproteobacteria bacterium]|nr:MAG: hypothetical protein KatS3mg121_1527 [Gammaproteobacteria bacterium]
MFPPPAALRCAQDRLEEKTLFERLGIPTAPWRPVAAAAELARAAADVGLPAVLKTRRLGYDGKGQTRLAPGDDLEAAWRRHGGAPSILEAFVAVRVRGLADRRARPRRRDGLLPARAQRAPRRHPPPEPRAAPGPGELQAQAEAWLERIMAELDYVGVLAVEFFVRDGALLANEMAPRVHNTGHWTIEGAAVSQFENHLRAVCGLPLGSTEAHSHAAMVNFIGRVPPAEAILAIPGCHFHDYGKAPRPGRKVGHATVRAADAASRSRRKSQRLLALVDDEAEAARRAARPA